MIRHIVMFKLNDNIDEQSKIEVLFKLKNNFESLKSVIPGIPFYEVGINISENEAAYDFVINSVFNTEADLKNYSIHPAHIKAVEFNRKFTSNKIVVDYTF